MQERFVEEYLKDLNASQAAYRAGYSAKNVGKIGSVLLGKGRIAEAMEEAKARRRIRTEVSQDIVIRELVLLATQDPDHYLIDDEGNVTLAEGAPAGAMRAISSVHTKNRTMTREGETETIREVRMTFWNKTHALELLGKHLAMFTEKVAHVGDDGRERIILTPEERLDRLVALAEQVRAARSNGHTPEPDA